MVELLLIALAAALDNFGAATALGTAGVDRSLRIRLGLVFGLFEGLMPVVGVLFGHRLARDLGSGANLTAGLLLCLMGIYTASVEVLGWSRSDGAAAPAEPRRNMPALVILGAALSIDNLVLGFALGATHVSLLLAALTIGLVSVVLSLAGLEVGRLLGAKFGGRAELIGAALLFVVGILVATGVA